MRYEDASQAAADHNAPVARPDVDVLPSGSYGPATGNALTGQGTTTGASGADSAAGPATIVAVQGAGGPGVMANGAYEVSGQYGALSIDTHGNFNYVRNPGTPDGVRDVFQYTLADASGTNASTTLTIDIAQVAAAAAGQTMVALPAGVELSDIHVNGRDLVINMPDGTQMVIPNGAVFVPQLTIGDVQVPATNVAALLIDSEPQPAAGPPQSSGGNFATDVPPLDPGVPLGDLIPPTEFGFTPPQFEELAQAVDRKPTVIIETPDNPAGVIDASESVNEKGLPARNGNEPAGSGEIADGNGTNDSDSTETNSGTIVFTAEDGLDSIAINGTNVTAVGQHIAGQFGTITITGIDLANGQVTYSYTLGDNTSGDATQDVFNVVVTDHDGDTATGSLTVHIIDDLPIALNDTDATDKTTHLATGNVISGADTTSGAAGADTVGADNGTITAISGAGGSSNAFDANGNLVVQGQFGTLEIKAGGGYTYHGGAGAVGGSVDTFTYTLTDSDGDSKQATLTITNPDQTPTIIIQTPDNPAGVVNATESVFEKGLPIRGGEPAGSGEIADHDGTNNSDSSETNTGTIVLTSPDGVGSVSINGTVVTGVNQHIAGASGTLTITSIDLATGHIGYSYTLTDNTSGDTTHDDFSVVVTDTDGDTATGTLTVHIVDDVPAASADTNSVAEGGSVSGNVETNDIPGADNFAAGGGVTGVVAGNHTATAVSGGVGTTIHGTYGDLVLNANGSYTYHSTPNSVTSNVQDTFTYTITDGDGDTSTTTLVINVNDTTLAVSDNDAIVNEAGLPAGTHAGDGSTIDSNGQISVSGGTGPYTYTLTSSATGAHGTLVLDSTTGQYTYTLTSAVDEGDVNNGADTVANGDHFTYTVTDSGGNAVTTGVINVDIIDDVPIARDDTDSVTEDTASVATGNVISGAGSDGNPAGGDSLGADGATVTLVDGLNAGVGQATATAAGVSIVGQYGTLLIHSDGSYTYTLNNANGDVNALGVGEHLTENFRYTLHDGDGDESSAVLSITINGTNDAPVAVADTNWTVEGGGSIVGNVLQSLSHPGDPSPALVFADVADTDVDGDTLNVTQVNGGSIANPITGAHGTLTINANGSYSYQVDNADPAVIGLGLNQTITDTFTYAVSDGHGGTASATLTITIFGTNDGPTAVPDTNWTVEDGGPISGNVIAGMAHPGDPSPGVDFADVADSDPNNDPLTITDVNGSAANVGNDLVGAHGTLHLNSNGTYTYQVNNADPAVQALSVGQTTTDSFTYSISDGNGGTASATLTITIFGANDAPTAVADTNWTIEDSTTAATGNVLQDLNHAGAPSGSFADHADTDPDSGDTLTVSTVNGNAANVGNNLTGAHGTLHLNSNGTYTYQVNNADPAVQALGVGATTTDTFSYTVSDGNGGTASATLTITIFGANDAPTAVADTNWTIEDSTTAATGNVLQNLPHPGDPSAVLSFADSADTDPDSGDTLTVSAVNGSAANVGNDLTGAHGTLHLNSTGTYTYQVNNSDGAVQALGVGDTLTDSFSYTVSDGHGGTATTTLTITIFGANDGPSIASSIAHVSEEGLPNANVDSTGYPDNSADTTNSAQVLNGHVTVSDPDNDPLTVTLSNPPAGITVDNQPVTWTLSPDGHTLSATVVLNAVVTPVMTITIDDSGNYTVNLQHAIDHPYQGVTEVPPGGEDAIHFDVQLNVSDGTSTSTGTLTIYVEDDSPIAAIAKTGQGVSLDESAGLQADSNDVAGPIAAFAAVSNVGVDPDLSAPLYASNNSAIVASTGTSLGADGGAVSFGLDVSGAGVDSGLNTTDGHDILLYKEGSLVVGRVSGGAADGKAAFAIAIDSSGKISMVEYLSIQHLDAANPDDSVSIATSALLATVTATDTDGDKSVASTAIGNLISFQDSGPIMTAASNINIQNSGDVAADGTFAYLLGADGAPASNDVFKSVTFSASVNGTTVQTTTPLTQVSEDAHTATFSFSFTYGTGVGTATENGTITFYKDGSVAGHAAGTYTVDLQDPIAGVSTFQTAQGTAFVGYVFNTTTTTGSQPDVAVTTIKSETAAGAHDGFYVQFTGFTAGNASHETIGDGNVTTFVNGDLVSEGSSLHQSWVSVSNASNGVAGDTINGPDGLNFSLYNSDPKGLYSGTLGNTPTASADSMFLRFDGVDASDDLVVVLKLWNDGNHNGLIEAGEITSKAIIVDGGDIYLFSGSGAGSAEGNTVAAFAGTPYQAVVAGIVAEGGSNNNDGIVVIESNDYNAAGESYKIVGAEIVNTADGITGTGINLNPTVGSSGGSSTSEAIESVVDTSPLKITNIGFLTQTTTAQSAQLTFNVTIQDGDGDTVTQAVTASVSGNADSSTAVALSAAVTTVAPVVLDLDGNGVQFLSTAAGVTYDYGHGAVATAWAAPQDGILVHDANNNGSVDNASEFVFGGAGQTDLDGLAAYDTNGDRQLNAADAQFASFAVWQDANSNGRVDAGELQSLMARGITSISLTSDGISYNAAGGDVAVAGTGSFTMANGSKGAVADAAFAIGSRAADADVRSPSASGSNLTVIAALAAAGLSSASASYAESHSSFHGDALPASTTFSHEAVAATITASSDGYHGIDTSSMLGSWLPHDVGRADASAPALHNEIVGRQALTTNDVKSPAFADLLQGSHGASHGEAHASTPVTAMAVAMPSAAQLAAAGLAGTNGHGQTVAGVNGVQHNEVVAKVLADSLNGGEGHGPNVEALVSQLSGHGGGHNALEALAIHGGGGASFGHMGFAGAFAGMHGMGMEMMHQDAAPAHG